MKLQQACACDSLDETTVSTLLVPPNEKKILLKMTTRNLIERLFRLFENIDAFKSQI